MVNIICFEDWYGSVAEVEQVAVEYRALNDVSKRYCLSVAEEICCCVKVVQVDVIGL